MTNINRTGLPRRFAHLITTMILLVVGSASLADGAAMENHGPKSFYIDIGKDAEAKLIRKVRSLKIGTSVEEVKSIVGEPTYDQMLIGKKGEFHARVLSYYIRQLDTGVNEIHDRYVSLYFDQANKLMSIGYKLTGQIESETYDEPR